MTTDGWLLLVCVGAVLTSFLLRAEQRHAVALDYDDGVYWQTALALASGDRPYTDVFHSQPPLFSEMLALPFRLGGGEWAARLLMLGWATMLVLAAGAIGWMIGDRRAGLVAGLVVALLPPMQRYCFQFGADLPGAALAASALGAAVWARADGSVRRRWWLLVGALLGTAVSMKLIAVVIVPAAVVLAVNRRSLAWMAAGGATTITAWLALLRPAPAEAWQQVVRYHLDASDAGPQPVPGGAVAMLAAWIVPFCLLAGLSLMTTLRCAGTDRRRPVLALLIWAAAGTVFVVLHRPIFEHHLLFFVVPGAAAIGSAVSLLLGKGERWKALGIASTAMICVLQAIVMPVSPAQDVRTVLACLRTIPRDTTLLTDDQRLAARAGLRTPPQLADTSWVRITSGHLQASEIIEAAGSAEAVLLAPPTRARITDADVLTWMEIRFPVRFEADGYRLLALDRLAGCPRQS
ncbi:glycosyltransferase family 39 protein [Micromonospora purpureochromogenes]|uniref:ArnT family glycosyltransferase n=1 Tax=Micromonospora purpureochromogenes TaxID=47872 RepID=UPI00340549F3